MIGLEILMLKEEYEEILAKIEEYEDILNNEKSLKNVIRKELDKIKKNLDAKEELWSKMEKRQFMLLHQSKKRRFIL